MSSCPKCNVENPEGTEVCANCGASLALTTMESEKPISQPRPAQQVSGLAIASLFLGALSILHPCLLVLASPAAFILSIVALVQIGNGQGAFRGRWMAITGMTCAILFPAIVVIFVPFYWGYPKSTQCTSNQRQIALAINMFCTENEETMPGHAGLTPESPDAEKQQWRTVDIDIYGAPAKVFDCKYSRRSGAPGPRTADYAMNADIMGVGLGQIPVPVATLLTADTKGTDAIFSAKDIDPRHFDGFIASFVDGHVTVFTAADVPHDPEVNLTGLGAPSMNKFLIQGATNVIDVKLVGRKWANPVVFAYTGYESTPWINGTSDRRACIEGDCISAFYSQVPSDNVVPKALTIGTFVNGPNAAPTPITLPVPAETPSAADMKGIYYTFRLPSVIGKTGCDTYRMTGINTPSVTVAPVKSGK